jgi:hypothetical protein
MAASYRENHSECRRLGSILVKTARRKAFTLFARLASDRAPNRAKCSLPPLG